MVNVGAERKQEVMEEQLHVSLTRMMKATSWNYVSLRIKCCCSCVSVMLVGLSPSLNYFRFDAFDDIQYVSVHTSVELQSQLQ